MRTDQFYDTDLSKARPLFFITKSQWEHDLETLTIRERNCFDTYQFKGKLGDLCFEHDDDGLISKVYVGAGEDQLVLSLAHVANRLPPGRYAPQEAMSHVANVMWSLAQYRFVDYKKQTISPRVLIVNEPDLASILADSAAVFLTRDLINKPANDLGPRELADCMECLAKEHGADFKQWVGEELVTDNFPAIHAVGRAAASPPRLLSLSWGDERHPRVAVVGKGVCFDSGGLDLKASAHMRLMKKDMGGAAHAIALAQWIMTKRLPVRLHVLVPAVENAVGSKAYRPGDVLTLRNGLTVEIDNTDAEGRLILADALVKACEEKPELLIDFATLTGAARTAVGTEIAAMFTNHDPLAQSLSESSVEVRDPIWRMPLFADYEVMLDSPIADLANSSASPYGGAITAALFLQRFVSKSVPWVHFDIMAWNMSSKPGKPEGGEAMAMRAVADYLSKRYKVKDL